VRRAFVLATDRKVLADVVLRGYRSPATGGFVPPGMPAHSPGIAPLYNPVQARRLLAEAGYPGGEGFPVVNLLVWQGSEPHTKYLQAQWQENLRVEVTWEVGQAVSLDRLGEAVPHMSLTTWVAGYPDPDDFLSGGVSNARRATRWRDDAYDRLVETAKRVTDQGERIKMYQQADRILVEEAIIMPLVYGQLHLLVKPWVSKFPTSSLKWWFWKDVVIEPH
jgi:oligopeptide transport system substrate-binding protein